MRRNQHELLEMAVIESLPLRQSLLLIRYLHSSPFAASQALTNMIAVKSAYEPMTRSAHDIAKRHEEKS